MDKKLRKERKKRKKCVCMCAFSEVMDKERTSWDNFLWNFVKI